MSRMCPRCKRRQRKKHHNSKWCHPCAEELKHRPRGTLTPAQRRFAIQHAGDMRIDEIARRLRTSRSNVKRSCRSTRFHAVNGKYKYNPALVRQVCEYYFEHGKPATIEAFPHISVISIVDRPEYYGIQRRYRQIRWTPEQHLEAVRMAGLVPLEAQAHYFNRPRANLGAMRSFWIKRVRVAGGTLHGMPEYIAREVVTDRCPRTLTEPWSVREGGERDWNRNLVLWIDAEKHLRPGTPEFLETAVRTMADFTRWIFASKAPKRKILKMIRERSFPKEASP